MSRERSTSALFGCSLCGQQIWWDSPPSPPCLDAAIGIVGVRHVRCHEQLVAKAEQEGR